MFGGVDYMPENEAAAGNDLGLAYGEAGQTMLANAAAREGMYRSSAAREAVSSRKFAQDALLQSMQDAVQGYNNQLSNISAAMPWQVRDEVERLRDQRLEQQLARSKMASDEAFSQWLQNYLGGSGGGGGGGAVHSNSTPSRHAG